MRKISWNAVTKIRTPGCIRRLLYFGQNSNIHGLRFIAERKRNILTRLFWLAVLGCSGVCLHLLLLAIMDTLSGAAINFTPDTLYLNWTTNFPAVTVCEKYNYRKSLKILTSKYPDLINAQDYTRRKYLIDLMFGEGTCKDCEPCGQKIPCDVDWRAMADSVRKPCVELISNCSWNSNKFDCCAKFLSVDSEKGLCYSLNTRQSKLSDTFSMLTSNRATGPGELMFYALSDLEVSVHSTEELATNSLNHELKFEVDALSRDRYQFLFSIVEVENEDELIVETVKFRKCRYLNEQPSLPMIDAYAVYSHSTCTLACETQLRFESCGCINYVRDLAYKDRYCNFTGLNCLVKFEERLKLTQDTNKDQACQNCLPSCVESELKRIHLRRYSEKQTDDEVECSRVAIRMLALPTLRYSRNILRTSLDLVVSVGGIAGLFFGASLLSLVEALYLVCLQRRPLNDSTRTPMD